MNRPCAVIVLLAACGPTPQHEHGTGYTYIPAHHASFSFLGTGAPGIIQRALPDAPTSADHTQWNPPVGDQGQLGTCAAWSTGYSVGGYLSNQAGSGTQLFAPMYIYDQAAAGCPDCGMEIGEAFGFTENGYVTAATYDAAVPSFTSYQASIPTIGVDAAANDLAGHAAVPTPTEALATYQLIFDAPPSTSDCAGAAGASSAIQVAISQAYPVVIALPVFPEFDNYDGVHPVQPPGAGELSRGGHAIMCTKFDADGLWCQNQWGAAWGAAGSVQLSWAFVDQCLYEADIGTALTSAGRTTPLPAITAPATGSTLTGSVTFDVSIPGPVQAAWIEQVNGGVLGTLAATGTGTDYAVQLDSHTLPDGSWIGIVAKAQDAAGNVAQSPPIEVQVENQVTSPVPVILAPAAGATITEPTTVSGSIAVPLAMQHGPLATGTPCASVAIALDGATLGNATLTSGGNDTATDAYYPQTFAYPFAPAAFANGVHALSATCVDGKGASYASAPVTIAIGSGIALAVTAPGAGATVSGAVPFTATVANVLSAGGTIALYDGATAVSTTAVTTTGTVTSDISWDTTLAYDGAHTLSARYTDGDGTLYTSAPVAVTVANPEAVIVAPSAGATVYGEAVTVTASATARCGEVTFYVDGNQPFAANLSCSGGTASARWNTTSIPDGPHVLTAEAYDGLAFSTSPPVPVIVQNDRTSSAEIQITSPTTSASVADQTAVVASLAPGTTTVSFYLDSYRTPVPTSDGTATTGLAVPPGATSMQVAWDTTQTTNGYHTLLAQSFDASGDYWLSPVVPVTVQNQVWPQVSFASLASTTVSGWIDVEVLVAPGRAPLASCDLTGDGTYLAQLTGTFPNGDFWTYIDTRQFANGTLELFAECTDTAGYDNDATLDLTVAN
ncbi:MAG TPA: Ig-like domain-containing protein [Kofleriaceae bacterium]|nr:Ig-like domain-containing protein [Kofleriaceae bacterium]